MSRRSFGRAARYEAQRDRDRACRRSHHAAATRVDSAAVDRIAAALTSRRLHAIGDRFSAPFAAELLRLVNAERAEPLPAFMAVAIAQAIRDRPNLRWPTLVRDLLKRPQPRTCLRVS